MWFGSGNPRTAHSTISSCREGILALTSGEHSGWISPGAGSTRAADPVAEPVGEAIVMLVVKNGGRDR